MKRARDPLIVSDVPPVLRLAAGIVRQAIEDAKRGDDAALDWLRNDADGLLAWLTPDTTTTEDIIRLALSAASQARPERAHGGGRKRKDTTPMIGDYLSQLSDAEFQAMYGALYGSGASDKESPALSAWYDVLRAMADEENDRRIGATSRRRTDFTPRLTRAARGLDDDQLAVLIAAGTTITRGMTKIPKDHPYALHEGQLLEVLRGEMTRRNLAPSRS